MRICILVDDSVSASEAELAFLVWAHNSDKAVTRIIDPCDNDQTSETAERVSKALKGTPVTQISDGFKAYLAHQVAHMADQIISITSPSARSTSYFHGILEQAAKKEGKTFITLFA